MGPADLFPIPDGEAGSLAARKNNEWHNAAAADLPCRLGNRQRKQPWWRYYRTSRRTCPKASAAARRGS